MKIKNKELTKSFTVDIEVEDTPIYQLENGIVSHNTTSLTLGTSSGIHAWHNDYYIRRIRVGKNEVIYTYLAIYHPELIEDDVFRPHDTAVISVPQKAPKGSILRTESPFDLLERIKKISMEWVKPGHIKGMNTHNVSATISLRDDEWEKAGEWMWENREHYNGLSVLPYNGGTYQQAPFEDCTEEKYNEMMKSLSSIDLSKIVETDDNTDLSGEIACGGGGGSCDIDIDLTQLEIKVETTNTNSDK